MVDSVLRCGDSAAGRCSGRDEAARERGRGAWLGGERIRVSGARELRQALLCTGFPYDIREDPEPALRLFQAYLRRARAVRRFGAAALDLAYVACGRFDGFWELALSPWDVAAGALLVREAGGVVTRHDGSGDVISRRGTVAAGNPAIHAWLLRMLAETAAG